jgi:diaminopimelate epimerase
LQSKKTKMQLTFYKYHGTGNDFILIDNRNNIFPKNNTKLISTLCTRRFGIGADGLILLENNARYDFTMVYYNSDGSTSTMCGNGGRCLVAFAKFLGIIQEEAHFEASDGYHYATIEEDEVALQMIDVEKIDLKEDYSFVYTGSPHHVCEVVDLEEVNVKKQGAAIRYSNLYDEAGSNVNFVNQINEDTFAIRTYERGVEDETYSCGTGATAVAIAMHAKKKVSTDKINIEVKGGSLKVRFHADKNKYTYVFLTGPAEQVFEGKVVI